MPYRGRLLNNGDVVVLNGKKLLADPAMRVYQEVVTSYKGGENVK